MILQNRILRLSAAGFSTLVERREVACRGIWQGAKILASLSVKQALYCSGSEKPAKLPVMRAGVQIRAKVILTLSVGY